MHHHVSGTNSVTQSTCNSHHITCGWQAMRKELLKQWGRLTPEDLDEAGPNRHTLAMLLQRKCGVDQDLAENYLKNFERTLPLE